MTTKLYLFFQLTFLFLSLFSSQLLASESSSSLTKDRLKIILNETINQFFDKELKRNNISIGIKNMPKKSRRDSFLQIRPKINFSLFRPSKKRHYYLEINPLLYKNNPGEFAIRAILIHELEHVIDYLDLNFYQLSHFGLKYANNTQFRYDYERYTDIKALKRGAGIGLADYRIWIYKQISPKDVVIKKMSYLTPEEIRSFLRNEN